MMAIIPGLLANEALRDRILKVVDQYVTEEKTVEANVILGGGPKKLNSEAIAKLDDKLKVLVTGIHKTLLKMDLKTATWTDITSAIDQCPLAQPRGDVIFRTDSMTKESSCWSLGETGPDQAVVKEVHAWFNQLISDPDVLETTQIDIDVLAKIVAATGIAIKQFENYLVGAEFKEKTIIEVGFVRYPDLDEPYFKVYRIRLTAWQKSKKTLGYNSNTNGISGDYNCQKYQPRESIMKEVKEEAQKKAVSEAEALLGL